MAKVKSKYVCQSCGYETAGYLGKCPECGSWGTFVEETDIPVIKDVQIPDNCPPMKLNEIEMNSEIRMSTNISEFDRVLGSGIVQGSLILIAGDPGIGKSTILLQTSGELCKNNKKVFIFGAKEEVLGKMKKVITEEYNGIIIAGMINGYIDNKDEVFVKMIKETNPDVILVALGIPLQEKLINRHIKRI